VLVIFFVLDRSVTTTRAVQFIFDAILILPLDCRRGSAAESGEQSENQVVRVQAEGERYIL